jgi:hypothetical protein
MSLEDSPSFQAFSSAPYKSTKRTSYFWVYDLLLQRFSGKAITVVEVGVLNGGGLFMLRKLLGDSARIIGVDLNPECKYFEKYGFEIYTLNQSNPSEWNGLFQKIGPIDVLIEDGGHTNKQQITTLIQTLDHIRDGGIYLSEDTHTSYWAEFGNPSNYSFIEYTKKIIDGINERGPNVVIKGKKANSRILSIQYFESMFCIYLSGGPIEKSRRIVNEGKSLRHADFRNLDKSTRNLISSYLTSRVEKSSNPRSLKLRLTFRTVNLILGVIYRFENYGLRRFFK